MLTLVFFQTHHDLLMSFPIITKILPISLKGSVRIENVNDHWNCHKQSTLSTALADLASHKVVLAEDSLLPHFFPQVAAASVLESNLILRLGKSSFVERFQRF
jgi:hypothetical protein